LRSIAGTAGTAVRSSVPPPPELGAEERETLLGVARLALAVATGVRAGTALDEAMAVARGRSVGRIRGAAFVTLTMHGELRGCVGRLDPAQPLGEAVAAAAQSAALEDPRFWPVQASELDSMSLEISALGPFAELAEPDALRPGIDGVMVQRGWRRGLLLPEVAVTMGWDGPALLSAACEKAGLPGTAWREPTTRLLAFRTMRFGGPALRSDPASRAAGTSARTEDRA